jgi:hypothetical protein
MPQTKTSKASAKNRPKRKEQKKNVLLGTFLRWWHTGIWQKLLTLVVALIVATVSTMYGIAQWYINKHESEPLRIGATFIPDYARSFGLDPGETMDAIIDDLGIKHLRLVSYWENGEAVQGIYDFSFLDWQMEKAHASGVKVSLAIGLRQPRWPECHMPQWAAELPKSEWQPKLMDYIQAVVERYRDHPALESWQLENEFFLKVFGICPDHSRDRLIEEFKLVKSLDSAHPLIVSRSNNALGWPAGEPQPDISAVSVYKRVWDKTLTKRYFEYPLPAWFYGTLAGWNELMNGNDTFVHELQAEAWLPDGFSMTTAPIDELYKSMNPDRLRDRIHYGVATGMRRVDLWGVEWWYYMKEVRDAPELWQAARETISEYQ